jgi:hypothetical protein
MLENIKPGSKIRCTLTSPLRTEAAEDTVRRLMWLDKDTQKGLRRAQRRRRQDMVVYNRGNRDWYQREKCARSAIPEQGATWTFTYSHQLAPDIASVAKHLKIEQA